MRSDALTLEFHEAMLEICRRAKAECRYPAGRFRQMIAEQGGLATARALLEKPVVSEGFTILWEKGRLDISMEAIVLQKRWRPLFTPAELDAARTRLTSVGFVPDES